MSDKPPPLHEQITVWLQVQVARFAMRFCGPAVLFWTAPAEWEEYMSVGEPYKEGEGEFND